MQRVQLLPLIAILLLVGCASPRNATIENGKVSNITSAEATTLMKGEQRRAKVADVQENQKSILKMVGHPGKPITIDAALFEINVPMDVKELLAEQASEVSENVQMFDRVVRFGERTVVPLVGIGALVSDRKDVRASTERIQEASIAADANKSDAALAAASKAPIILTIPVGGSAGFLKP